MQRRITLCTTLLALVVAVAPGRPAGAQQVSEATEEQLQRWLKQYPGADANGDGRLTVVEAEAYRQRLVRRRTEQSANEKPFPFQHEFTFATMSDGVEIALAVGYPRGFDASNGRKWPAIFTTCGYTGATAPVNPSGFANRCVTVNASLRGTGASGGALSPWTPRTWQDGYEIIEDWIAKQPWSNGRVGITGHSWPGLMGFLVATTNPPSLEAVCVSGLIEDFYRGIAWIGGVRNCGFPVDWLNNYYDADGPFNSGTAAQIVRQIDDAEYGKIVESRPRRDLADDMLWNVMYEPYDCARWREQSLYTYASRIEAPILIMHTYQDEQTGPTGWRLWKHLPEDTPKRLILTNGAHNVAPAANPDSAAWFERWLLDDGKRAEVDRRRRVQVHFETRLGGPNRSFHLNAPLEASDFPLPDTAWSRFYLRSGQTLADSPPAADEPPDAYRVTHGEPSGESERLDYVLQFDEPTAICGPAVLTLWAELTTLDADFFALVADLAPDGTLYGLQRGLLRASHRQLDEKKSAYALHGGQKILIRPHHPHTRAEPITPGQAYRFEIPIFAVGHVFRPGHKLVLRLSRPPLGDPIGITKSGSPSYRYDSDRPPGIVKVLHDTEHASSLLLPILPTLPPISTDPPPLPELAGIQAVP
ncbi:MAG: CocE/NonD family hydrolase [Planctomycetes bacterium]|nr:CocE/NonD family hydrolase [Planctomycetota bacterium]